MIDGHAIGLDIGGGSTKIGLVDTEGHLQRALQVVLPADSGFDTILARFRDAVASLSPAGRPVPIGIAYPGHVDRRRGVGLNSNVPALDGHPLAAALAGPAGPAALLNDADAAALAEARQHPEGREGRMLMVTLGTGIGVAMVVEGRRLETAGGTLGDAGHLNLDPSGRHRCRQGCTGCLESVASGEALARDATALARAGASTGLVAALASEGTVTTAALCRLALGGDAAARQLVDGMADWLAMAVATWRAMFHPDLIVVGGGLSVLGPDFVASVRERAEARALPFAAAGCRMVPARLGNDAGMIGAALVALTP